MRRIGRDGNDPGVQTSEESRHELQTRRVEQESPLSSRDRARQARSDRLGSLVQVGIGKARRDFFPLGEVDVATNRLLDGAAPEERHQGL
jgi:hypothetical protein